MIDCGARRSLTGVTILAAVLAVLYPAPAAAHPWGPPPTAVVSVEGTRVAIEWSSAADDAVAVGVEVGLMPEEAVQAYLEAPTQVAPSAAQEEALSASQELRGYVEDNITVRQDGRDCDMRIAPMDNFVSDGVRTVHACAEPVEQVDIAITMLHDRHPAYRTFAVTDGDAAPEQAVYSTEGPVHTWDFTAGAGSGVTVWPLLAVAGVLAGGLAVAFMRAGRDHA